MEYFVAIGRCRPRLAAHSIYQLSPVSSSPIIATIVIWVHPPAGAPCFNFVRDRPAGSPSASPRTSPSSPLSAASTSLGQQPLHLSRDRHRLLQPDQSSQPFHRHSPFNRCRHQLDIYQFHYQQLLPASQEFAGWLTPIYQSKRYAVILVTVLEYSIYLSIAAAYYYLNLNYFSYSIIYACCQVAQQPPPAI